MGQRGLIVVTMVEVTCFLWEPIFTTIQITTIQVYLRLAGTALLSATLR